MQFISDIKNYWNKLYAFPLPKRFEMIPIIGGLRRTEMIHHWHTLAQIAFIVFFALLPSLIFGFSSYIETGDLNNTLRAIDETVKHGELYMISASLLGPMTYIALVDESKEPFPNRTSILFLTMVILIFSSVGYLVINKLSDSTVDRMAIDMSFYMLMVTIIIVYLVTVYKRTIVIDISEQDLRDDIDNRSEGFINSWDAVGTDETEISFGDDNNE